MPDHSHAAPGELEAVRRFINTWSIPNLTRIETDDLPHLARDPAAWRKELSHRSRQRSDRLDTLLRLRADLRELCEGASSNSRALNDWFDSVALAVKARPVEGAMALTVEPADKTFVAYILAAVANAIASGEWSRLKTCADCRWAFYDRTRNGSKRWCGMTKGGPDGRACGTIAKVSAYRAREAAKAPEGD